MRLNDAEQQALLELFATIDSVYTEPDAFSPEKQSIGFGRVFRAWKRARDVLARQSYAPLQSRIPRTK